MKICSEVFCVILQTSVIEVRKYRTFVCIKSLTLSLYGSLQLMKKLLVVIELLAPQQKRHFTFKPVTWFHLNPC